MLKLDQKLVSTKGTSILIQGDIDHLFGTPDREIDDLDIILGFKEAEINTADIKNALLREKVIYMK